MSGLLDRGTGSGAIGFAHERPRARILATDASMDALTLARENARRFSTFNVEFMHRRRARLRSGGSHSGAVRGRGSWGDRLGSRSGRDSAHRRRPSGRVTAAARGAGERTVYMVSLPRLVWPDRRSATSTLSGGRGRSPLARAGLRRARPPSRCGGRRAATAPPDRADRVPGNDTCEHPLVRAIEIACPPGQNHFKWKPDPNGANDVLGETH